MKRAIWFSTTLLTVLVLAATLLAPAPAAAQYAAIKSEPSLYIVQMVNEPAVAYEGDITGLAATAVRAGQKLNPRRPEVIAYRAYLNAKHDAALLAVGGAQKAYDYYAAFNGFAARLTAEQAEKMASVPGVLSVSPNTIYTIDTSSTPDFLGLTEDGGLWDMLGGVKSAGENIIIGVIDSGIWPESLSFADRADTKGKNLKGGKLLYRQIPDWYGECQTGEDFDASDCNLKLIGARYFNTSQGGDDGVDADMPWEFNSPRDYNGHGTHTTSTAGGNNGVEVPAPGEIFGTVSGIAPRARVAMYKALWSTETGDTASGACADLIAAIDYAVADGVDVINYSISGSMTFFDPMETAFLYAARAGIFVAASAGNEGPDPSSVAHGSPWLTTVAAGTHNRGTTGSVTLGNLETYQGASLASYAVTAPLINSWDAGLEGADLTLVTLCYAAIDNGGVPVLDPAKVAGKIVVCDRGTTARVNKSLAVMEAGGVGMLLINVVEATLAADFHSVPSVHLQVTYYDLVHDYAALEGATATINKAELVYDVPAPFTADFSSRGPLHPGGGDILKPDLIAPGVDILAAVSPTPSNFGMSFSIYSGTSMSSPHVAGLAALLKDLHPDWTPMMIKSALMTSGYDILDGPATDPLVIFSQGAGHVQPNSAADPGLVFDAGWNDWQAFICGQKANISKAVCDDLAVQGYSFDASDLNLASIGIGDLHGAQTVTRSVTNVGAAAATYSASVIGMEGIDVVVEPAVLTIEPGQSAVFTVTFTNVSAAPDQYVGGYLTWTSGAYAVRIPLVVQPVE